VRRSDVLENAFVSGVRFAELGPGRRAERPMIVAPGGEVRCERVEAEWTAKMNKAFERGLAQGEAHAQEKVKLLVQALGEARRELADLAVGLEAKAEKHAVELALKLTEIVMRTQPAFDENALRSALDEALRRTAPDAVLRIRVNPADVEPARSLGEPAAQDVEIVADPDVGRGGCVLDTKLGEIDSTIEYRWEAAQKLLRELCAPEEHDAP